MPVHLAYQNKLKITDKIEIFEKFNERFGTLAKNIEYSLSSVNSNNIEHFSEEYESLIKESLFQCISENHEKKITTLFLWKCIPEQLLLKKTDNDKWISSNVIIIGNYMFPHVPCCNALIITFFD